jgi:hypothetical protein
MKFDIKKQGGYFHDGSLIDIQHTPNQIVLSLESAEMDLIDVKDQIQLSERNTFKGKLHLENVKNISVNDIPNSGILQLPYDTGSIFDLTLTDKMIELQIVWVNFPPKPYVNDFSTIKIEAGKIWWENIPDLHDPFW